MKGPASALRDVPRSVLVFGAFHLLLGTAGLTSLILSHCVDRPCPPGMYCFDGCSLIYDPWDDGTWQYPLAAYIAAIASSILVVKAYSFGRLVLLLALASWFAYFLYLSTVLINLGSEADATEETQRGWGAALADLGSHASPYWLIPLGWLAFCTWFLYRRHGGFFQGVPNDNHR